MQVRLYQWQVERLRQSGCGAKVLQHAFRRFKRGDFGNVVQCSARNINGVKVPLSAFSVRVRLGVTDSELRDILAMHFANPDTALIAKQDAEIKRMDSQIGEMMKQYTGIPFIMEENNNE